MAEKKSVLKEKGSLVILFFSLICFGLVFADLGARFNDTVQHESGMVKTLGTQQQGGFDPMESETELTPEELKQLINEQMSGEACG